MRIGFGFWIIELGVVEGFRQQQVPPSRSVWAFRVGVPRVGDFRPASGTVI